MEELLAAIQKHGVNLTKLNALEMFGRGGDWHTIYYAKKINSLEVWEVDIEWKQELERNLPNANLKFVDTIRTLANNTNLQKYSFVVIDNPQNLFGPNLPNTDEPQYCEHFDVLPYLNKILDDGIVVFNVNPIPYNYEKFPSWQNRRRKFYGNVDTSNLHLNFLIDFYTKFFLNQGFDVRFQTYVRRITPTPIEVLYYFGFYLTKNN